MSKRNISEGARAALLKVTGGKAQYTDAILAALWLEGFKLVQLDAVDLEAGK